MKGSWNISQSWINICPKDKSLNLSCNEDLWPEVKDIDIQDNIRDTLLENHSEVFNTINKILSVKIETDDRTIDQMMFDIMERKNKI